MLKIFCITMLVFCFAGLSAQNNLSSLNDIYSGINSAVISPTQPFLNPNPWDANLLSADAFLNNDYAYISSESILGLRNATIVTANPDKNISGQNQSDVLHAANFYVAFKLYPFWDNELKRHRRQKCDCEN